MHFVQHGFKILETPKFIINMCEISYHVMEGMISITMDGKFYEDSFRNAKMDKSKHDVNAIQWKTIIFHTPSFLRK